MLKLDKRITLSVAGVLALGAITAIIGTTAFFKDTKSTTNTFTVGNVDLEVTELQRGIDPTTSQPALVPFVQEKTLAPLVGSEGSAPLDEFLLPSQDSVKNYGDKVVTATNTGKSEAYVRAYVAIPAALDDDDPNKNILHFNFGRNAAGKKTNDTSSGGSGDWIWKATGGWGVVTATIPTVPLTTATGNNADIPYNIYHADYKTTIGAGVETERLLNGAYLDTNITDIKSDDTDGTTIITIKGQDIDLGFDVNTYGMRIPVYFVAVQADGFDSVAEAMTASGFDYDTNPWTVIENE